MEHLDSIQLTYVSGINHGRENKIYRFRTNLRHRFDSRGDNKVFFHKSGNNVLDFD